MTSRPALDAAYRGLVARDAWAEYAARLAEDGIRWMSELDLHRIRVHLAALPRHDGELEPARLRALRLIAASPAFDVAAIGAVSEELHTTGDPSGALCARCGQLYAIWSSGRHFDSQLEVIGRIQALIADENVPDVARASALDLLGMALLIGPGDLAAAGTLFRRGLALAEAVGSVPLRLYGATGVGYCLLFAGQLGALEALLFDADALAEAPQATLVAGAQYAIMRSLCDISTGHAEVAEARLAAWLDDSGRELLPVHWLLASCHRVTAAACFGDVDAVTSLVARVHAQTVVHQRHFFQAYVHNAMCLVNLVAGRPAEALAHAERAAGVAELSGSRVAAWTTPLMHARALAERGRGDEAVALYEAWIPRWKGAGFELYAAGAHVELAKLALDRGEVDRARQHIETASTLAPIGDPPRVVYRPLGFGVELALRLAPPTAWAWTGQRIRVRALGALAVERVEAPVNNATRRAPGTTLEVLAAVLAYGGAPAPVSDVADRVWPTADGDSALHSLNVALSRLRRAGAADGGAPVPWIHVRDHHIELDPGQCAVDCFAAADLLDYALARPEDADTRRVALSSYHGEFLGKEIEAPWSHGYRDALRAKHQAVLTLKR